MLSNNLREHFLPAVVKQSLEQAGIEAGVRAEAVTLEQMAALYRILSALPGRTELGGE
jgi:16S rRNA A1518/A1519 N6-dimethyltransferase RsmA/KsgA/DIM1 with predicted DNA glycosylase/AP lyase activity